MSQSATTVVHVHVDLDGEAILAGTAYVSERRGAVSTSFDYEASYQAARSSYALGPDLSLTMTRHHRSGLPGAFSDSAPDRWGRNLIRKRIQAGSGQAGRSREIAEVDYLLGVSDVTRQGALRFTGEPEGPFLAADADVPRLLELPRLLAAADQVGADGSDDMAAVKVLLDAGSGSLGGARPKASVLDDGRLLIAKFPHMNDEWNVMAWEKTALDLAGLAGIHVPRRRLIEVGGRSVLLLDRFDREGEARIGYISAMTLVEGADGQEFDYIELAEALAEHGSSVRDDLAQLWRRIAFSVVMNNTDDHLRNHGFLRRGSGWQLSPAFDINPEPDPAKSRVTSIGYANDAAGCREALFQVADHFGLDATATESTFGEVVKATEPWRQVASDNGIGEAELGRFGEVLDRFR